MNEAEIKEKSITILENLVTIPYSEIFQISPAQRDLLNLHMQAQNLVEPLIALMFSSIMLGNKNQAKEYANKAWNIGGQLTSNIEMLYVDSLINIGESEKAKIILQTKMENLEENLNNYFNAVVKYSLYTGELYILENLAQNPKIYITEPPLFNFAKKYASGLSNKHYCTMLKIIYDVLRDNLCAVEYMNHPKGLQMCLYTSLNTENNLNVQHTILDKIKGYYISMQENYHQDVFVRLENVNLHPSWW